jgi:hypothetical protein
MENKIKTYPEFYRFYLSEHRNRTCRMLHFIGTALVFLIAVIAVYTGVSSFWFIIPVVGYGFAWVGHFYFERNKPATFTYPLWSLYSDFKMFFQILGGKISFDSRKDR